jgi:DNA-binding transcriptional regulator YhcF (GntR family)
MLEKLFGSRARVKILKNFLLNPDKKFYIRQLARDLKLQVNSVRRELSNLEEFGLLSSDDNNNINSNVLSNTPESKKNSKEKENKEAGLKEKKYYWVNKNFILFSEIKSLIVKSQILAGESFIKNLKLVCDPKFILLSGIFVNNENSPTDVLIVANVENDKLIKIINDLEQELSREVNFTVMDEAEFKYRQEVADVFLHSVLNARRIILLDKILNINNESHE